VEPWEVELNEYLEGSELKLTAMAYDPGADDLTFTWDFDDGTLEQKVVCFPFQQPMLWIIQDLQQR
jgi:hypothetical protein